LVEIKKVISGYIVDFKTQRIWCVL